MESRSREKRDRANAQLEQASTQLKEKENELKSIVEDRRRLQTEAESAHAEGERLNAQSKALKDLIVECDGHIRTLTQMERSKYAQFGTNMEQVVAEIQRSRWHGQPPVGPFGLYVKVREPEKWGKLLQVIIGGMMSSFAITDARDRPALADILSRSGKSVPFVPPQRMTHSQAYSKQCQIIISEVDLFDFSEGEPPQNYLTVLRALEV